MLRPEQDDVVTRLEPMEVVRDMCLDRRPHGDGLGVRIDRDKIAKPRKGGMVRLSGQGQL